MTQVARLVRDTGENKQTGRFRWHEHLGMFYVWDSHSGLNEQGVRRAELHAETLFCEDKSEGDDCLQPGTQRFYDALNAWFNECQAEIGKEYFDEDTDHGRRRQGTS
jgi:hypothetical protein